MSRADILDQAAKQERAMQIQSMATAAISLDPRNDRDSDTIYALLTAIERKAMELNNALDTANDDGPVRHAKNPQRPKQPA